MCSRAVKTSNSRSGGPGFKPRPSRCFLRQGTLLHFVSLHLGVQVGTGDTLQGSNPAMDWHPVQGGVAILLGMPYTKETGISAGRSSLWLVCAFTLPYHEQRRWFFIKNSWKKLFFIDKMIVPAMV